MTVIRPNSVSGINSITAQADEIKVFKSNGTQGGLIIGGANLNATTGISTILALNVTGNVSIAGTLTYQDVTNVDSVGIITARSGVNISGGNLQMGGTNVLNSGRALYNLEQIKLGDSKELVLGSGNDLKIYHSGVHSFISEEGNGALKFKGDDIRFEDAGGTERLRINNSGEFGVGTDTPLRRLHVKSGANTNDGAFRIESATGNIMDMGTDGTGHFLNCVNADPFRIKFAGTERLRIESGGNVRVSDEHLRFDTTGKGIIFGIDGGSNRPSIIGNYTSSSDNNMVFNVTGSEKIRIDTNGISGTVKNNFLLNEFRRGDTSSQYGPLSTSFATDTTISDTISNYQRGQRIIIRATVPCGIALNNSSGTNYAGTSARIKVTNGSASTYSNDRASWYRADGNGTHETTQNLFICVYIPETSTDFTNGETLTVNIQGQKNGGGAGSSTHYLGGWSSSKEITIERYIKEL